MDNNEFINAPYKIFMLGTNPQKKRQLVTIELIDITAMKYVVVKNVSFKTRLNHCLRHSQT